jgi:hypothetical protein
MFDASLQFEVYLPAAGQSISVNAMDLGIDIQPFSENFRVGRLRIAWPALPNHVAPAKSITITLTDSADGGATFQSGASGTGGLLPVIQIQIAGVAVTGSLAAYSDVSLPPGLRGPIGLAIAVPVGDGDCTAALITSSWGSN